MEKISKRLGKTVNLEELTLDERIKKLISGLELTPPATIQQLKEVESKLGVVFPTQYVEFMLWSNGAEGKVGNSYLVIWPLDQLIPLNEDYAVEEFTPGLIYFGSDGGGMAYAFDKRVENVPVVEFPFESIHINDAKHCGNNFNEFLEYLYHRD